jgi:AraC-like DNA-binding protein
VKDRKLTELADLYREELQYISIEGEMITRGLLLALMKRLRRHLASAPVPLSNSAWPDIPHATQKTGHLMSEQLYQRATQYIGLHLQDGLTWEMLSKQFGVSPFYLNRVFRQFTGMPVMRYVNSQRIEAAKQMLSSQLERVNDIARLTGFASLGSFSNSFKKHVGCAPSEFRRRMDRKP